MKKKIVIIVCLCICVLIVASVLISLQKKERTLEQLNNIRNIYIDAVEKLCEEYKLSDAKIIIGGFSEKYNNYTAYATVESELFETLPGSKAFQFAKNFSQLDYEQNSNIDVSFITIIEGVEDTYQYEVDYSSTGTNITKFEYLVYFYTGESLVTYTDGTLTYDVF